MVWTADGFIPTADSGVFTADGFGPTLVTGSISEITPVFVSEDTIYAGSRRDPAALLFWRKAATTQAAAPWFVFRTPPPPAWLFQDRFVSVYPVLEDFAISAAFPAGALNLFRPSYRPPAFEEEYRRVNHQLYFQTARTYAFSFQFTGVIVDVPDFNDEPWREWVHPAPSPESLLYPFRQIPVSVRGHQFNLFWNQPLSPRLDPEPDKVRPFDYGVMWLRPSAVPVQLTTCGAFDIYDYGNGSILVAWPPFIGGVPDSYNLYVNGVFNQNVPTPLQRLAVIVGLFGASYNGVVVTAATTYQIKIVAVSAGVEVAESDTRVTAQPTSTMLGTAMKRPFPFPNSAPGG